MKNTIFALMAGASLLACNQDPSESLSEPTRGEVPTHEHLEDNHSHDVSTRPVLKAFQAETFKPFDASDVSTWGEVVETDVNGQPTSYARLLPNGNVQNLAFFHGWENKKFDRSDNYVGAKYYHWNRPNKAIPIVFIDATTKPEWGAYLRDAVKKWDKSEMFSLQVGRPVSIEKRAELIEKCNSQMKGYVLACNYEFRHNNKMDPDNGGYAVVEATPQGHIYSAVIHFNDKTDRFNPTKVEPSLVPLNKEFMVCHEVGHALGLWHAGEDKSVALGTCMDYSDNPKPNLSPDQHDLDELERIYGHSHDQVPMGYVCKGETGSETYTSYVQSVNGGVKVVHCSGGIKLSRAA